MLRAQLEKVTELMREVYSDSVVVMSATVEESKQLARRTRSILQATEVRAADGLYCGREKGCNEYWRLY